MKPTEAQLAERLPVWEALSDFFLDTELQNRITSALQKLWQQPNTQTMSSKIY